MFIHRDIYKNNLYNINLKALSDYEFVLTHYLICEEKFHYVPKTYVNYRLDGYSSKIGIQQSIYEGVVSRKNSGLSIYKIILSIIFRFFVFLTYKYYLCFKIITK
jgi:hypothetical protein